MSRSGTTNFDSDTAFDYFSELIADRLEREIEYWVSPEHVYPEGSWLANVITVVEIMLLLEQDDIGHSVYIRHQSAVQRWRNAFMSVWDSQWVSETNYPKELNDEAYRKQHRPAVEAIFERLDSIAQFWEGEVSAIEPPLTPLLPDYPLPYFSIQRINEREIRVERFTSKLIEMLQKELVYWLSPEKRGEVLAFNVASEEIPAAAELLAFLCEKYEQTPLVNADLVRKWGDLALNLIREFEDDWLGKDERLNIVKMTFDRLESVAEKHPPDILW